MEGPVYLCDYLGYKTLNKPATSVAGLQPGVKDLYLQFRRAIHQGGAPRKSSFKVTPGGLLVSLHESGGPMEMFFDITCVNLIQAVRFALLKGSEKKPKAVFVPIDESRSTFNVDKSAFSLDKSFHFLTQASHPPLLVCVLRRPKGVKAMDCHVFGMDSPDDVLYVQSLVRQLVTSGGSAAGGEAAFNRSSTRGDFIRTEFGDYNVYRGGGQGGQGQGQKFELKDEYFRGGGGGEGGGGGGGYPASQLDPGPVPRGGGQPSPRETYPAESSERPRFGWSYDKPQSGEDFRRISGHYGGSNNAAGGGSGGRPLSGDPRPGGNQFPEGGGGGGQYYPDTRAGGGQYPGERRSAELGEDRSGFRGGSGYRRPEFDRSEISHVRERSGDSGGDNSNRITGINRKVSGGSDYSGGGGGGGGWGGGEPPPQDSRYTPVSSPRSEAPPKVMQKPVSPVRVAAGPALPPPGSSSPVVVVVGGGGGGGHHHHHAPLSPRVSSGEAPSTPRTPTSPYSPPGPPTGGGGGGGGGGVYNEGPAFSLSNRESRGTGEEAENEAPSHGGKPVAKVPPHLKGVKVLPSDFLAVKLKPKQQRSESQESEHGYDNHQNILTQYKQLQLQEQDSQEGFTGFDDRDPLDKPGGGGKASRTYTSNWNDDDVGIRPATTSKEEQQQRRYIEQYSDQDRPQGPRYEDGLKSRGHGGSAKYRDSDAGGPGGGVAGDWRSASLLQGHQGGYSAGSSSRVVVVGGGGGGGVGGLSAPSSAANDEQQQGRKKDAEIASMFSNFRLQGQPEAFNPDRNNFEQSLGYLP